VRFVPCLTRSTEGGELRLITLGHRLVDDYIEFVAARGAVNTWLATAYDLKVFFEVVGKEPAEVRTADVFAFLAEQRRPRRGEKVVRIEDGEAGAGGAHDRQALVERGGLVRVSARPPATPARPAIPCRGAWRHGGRGGLAGVGCGWCGRPGRCRGCSRRRRWTRCRGRCARAGIARWCWRCCWVACVAARCSACGWVT